MNETMELVLENGMLIRDIQKKFNDLYPFLKIEFYKEKHPSNQLSPRNGKLDHNAAIDSIRNDGTVCQVDIDGEITVGQLEKEFWDKAGLSVQVFRKSGNLWIETSLTDDWTLEKQNKAAELFMQHTEKLPDLKNRDKEIDME
jgi:hypothetical protein